MLSGLWAAGTSLCFSGSLHAGEAPDSLHKTARHDVSVSVKDKLYLYTGTPIRSEYECDEALARLIYINATCCCIFGKGEKLNAQKSTVKEKICLIFHL